MTRYRRPGPSGLALAAHSGVLRATELCLEVHAGIGAVAHQGEAVAEDVTSLATIVARMDPQTALAEGQIAKVHVETTRLHFFDPATGLAIRD